MAGVRMSAPKGRVRIDRQRGKPSGFAHHAEEQHLPPPGHAERISAHRERVAREQAEWRDRHLAAVERSRSQPIERRPPPPRPRPAPKQSRRGPYETPLLRLRRRVLLFLAGTGDEVTSADVRRLFSIPTKRRVNNLFFYHWFVTTPRRGRPGGGSLSSIVTLSDEGRAEAERLAREGGAHADQ